MKSTGLLLIAALALSTVGFGTVVSAEETKTPAPFAESVKGALEASVGRVVTLQLSSGQEITGTVTKVGDHAVQISRLAGRDFYDALVVLDKVSAVLFKVTGR